MAGNFTATRTHIYVSGAVIYAANHNTNEVEVYGKHNAAFNNTTGHEHTGATGDGPNLPATSVAIEDALMIPPIGSIIPFNDFSATVTYSATYWELCDGNVVVSVTSPLAGLTKPDLSGRYIVGYGTDGGGDIGGAGAMATVGQASHQINLQHAHTMTGHLHTIDHGHADTFTTASDSHSHTSGTLQFQTGDKTSNQVNMYESAGTSRPIVLDFTSGAGGSDNGYVPTGTYTFYTKNGSGSTASDSHSHTVNGSVTSYSGNSGSQTDTMNNQLSTTQTIQPRSVQVRYLLRVL